MSGKPRRLGAGDRLAAVTLSWGGPGAFPHRYEAGKRQLEQTFGVEVVEMPHTLADAAFVADHPQARVDDLHQALADPDIAGIVSTIGGDDSIRLLPLLDLDLIGDHPKVLLGYSDTAITHLACHRAGLVTFYGPSIMAGFAENGGMHAYTEQGVRQMLFSAARGVDWPPNRDGWTAELLDWSDPSNQQRPRTLQPSSAWRWLAGDQPAEGRLLPVCLEVFDWLRGSEWWPALDGAVLALETSEEAPPPVALTRFLRSLALTGELGRLAALLLGRPGGDLPVEDHESYDAAVLQVVRDEQAITGMPVVNNLDFGHTDPMWTLPVGTTVRVDPVAERITFVDSPTR